MAIVNYVREHMRFIEYAADEHVTTGERLLWYALMHIFNQRAQGNVWPDEFIRISNDRLLSYAGMKFDTMAEARNRLRQRGLIEFTKGERNKMAPSYRMIYFYPQYKAPATEQDGIFSENGFYPEKSDYMGDNLGDYMGDYLGDYPGDYLGDININYTYTERDTETKETDSHTDGKEGYRRAGGPRRERAEEKCGPARSGAEARRSGNEERGESALRGEAGRSGDRGNGPARRRGEKVPPKYDGAWKTSSKVRGAVAQRIIDGLPFEMESGTEIHGRIVQALAAGVNPEAIEDCGRGQRSVAGFLCALDRMTPEEKDVEWEKCMRIALGNEAFARRLYRVSVGEEEKAE